MWKFWVVIQQLWSISLHHLCQLIKHTVPLWIWKMSFSNLILFKIITESTLTPQVELLLLLLYTKRARVVLFHLGFYLPSWKLRNLIKLTKIFINIIWLVWLTNKKKTIKNESNTHKTQLVHIHVILLLWQFVRFTKFLNGIF